MKYKQFENDITNESVYFDSKLSDMVRKPYVCPSFKKKGLTIS